MFPFDRVICAMHGILYVAQHRIHPDKIGQLNAFCTASSHYFQMMLIGGLNVTVQRDGIDYLNETIVP